MTKSLQRIGWSALDASSIHLAFITRDSVRAVGIPDGVAADYLGRTLRLAADLARYLYHYHPALKPEWDDGLHTKPEDTRTTLTKMRDFALAYTVMGVAKLYREDPIGPLWRMDREE